MSIFTPTPSLKRWGPAIPWQAQEAIIDYRSFLSAHVCVGLRLNVLWALCLPREIPLSGQPKGISLGGSSVRAINQLTAFLMRPDQKNSLKSLSPIMENKQDHRQKMDNIPCVPVDLIGHEPNAEPAGFSYFNLKSLSLSAKP